MKKVTPLSLKDKFKVGDTKSRKGHGYCFVNLKKEPIFQKVKFQESF